MTCYNLLYKYGNFRGREKKTQNLATVALIFHKKIIHDVWGLFLLPSEGNFAPNTFYKADLKYVDCVIEFFTKIYCNQTFFLTESTTNCTFQAVNCSFRGLPPTTQLRLFPCCETTLIVLCNWRRNNDSMLLLPCTICLPVYQVWVFHNTRVASSQSLLGPYCIILYCMWD